MPQACGELVEPCGGIMKVVGFIEEETVIERILKHCGKWKVDIPRPPPRQSVGQPAMAAEPALDYGFFEENCI